MSHNLPSASWIDRKVSGIIRGADGVCPSLSPKCKEPEMGVPVHAKLNVPFF